MFGIAVFAALIKLWSPDVSSPASFAAEPRTSSEVSPLPSQTRTLDIETRKPLELDSTPQDREQYVRPTLDIPDEKEASVREPETSISEDEPPVFYRPESEAPGNDLPSETGPVCGDLGEVSKSSRVVFPLQDDYFYSYDDTWGAPRPQGGHEGTDLMTPDGVPEYAITDGTIVPVSGSKKGWNTLGGYTVMVRADYDIGPVREGDLFYYAHMDRESALPIGAKVRAGQVVGYSGDTGQGPEVTRRLFPPHLHLGWYDGGGDRSDLESGAMNPYPLLEWLKRNGGSVVGGSGAEYCEAPRTDDAPSVETETWSANSPGKSPDLDTGTKDPRPSPVAKRRPISNAEKSKEKEPVRATPTRREKVRATSQKTRDVGENDRVDGPQASPSRKGKRRTDRPDPPERNRATMDPPPKEVAKEERPVAGTPTRENDGSRQDTETPTEKPENSDSMDSGKERSERPENSKPSEEGGCTTPGCSVEPDDPETAKEQQEETTITSEPGTTVPEDSEVESKPGEAVEPPAGEDEVFRDETTVTIP